MSVNRRQFIVLAAAGVVGCRNGITGQPAGTTKLTIDFSGLCGVVLSGSPKIMDVLLVDGMQTLEPAKRHIPRLVTDPKNVASESTPYTACQIDSEDMACWDLTDHRVTLMSAQGSGVQPVTGHRNPNHKKPETEDERPDVSWLATMSQIAAAGPGRINPQCLAPDPRQGKIAGAARFNSGEMRARFRKPKFAQTSWRVTSPNVSTPYEQALGELELYQEWPSETVTFSLEPFTGGQARQVVLRAQGNKLLVRILNEPEQLMCASDADARNLKHFAAFYQLLAPPNQAQDGPTPVCPEPECQLRCVGDQGEPIYCPPASFEA